MKTKHQQRKRAYHRLSYLIRSVAIGLGFCLIQLALSASAIAGTPDTWEATGSMATAREAHTATLLPNGKVLIAGGFFSAQYFTSTLVSTTFSLPHIRKNNILIFKYHCKL